MVDHVQQAKNRVIQALSESVRVNRERDPETAIQDIIRMRQVAGLDEITHEIPDHLWDVSVPRGWCRR